MPIVDGLNFTDHGLERAQERGISTDDIRWAMNGARRGIEEGKTLCQRWYTDANGYRWGVFVILSAAGRIITTWVREG
jgi:hypothetical protein